MPGKLGSTLLTAVIAPTGSFNAGKWTATFDPHSIGVALPEFECYHVAVASGPPGSTFQIYIGTNLWDSVAPGDVNSWDPNNPMPIEQGQSVYFYWNTGKGTAPMVTMWFQQPGVLR